MYHSKSFSVSALIYFKQLKVLPIWYCSTWHIFANAVYFRSFLLDFFEKKKKNLNQLFYIDKKPLIYFMFFETLFSCKLFEPSNHQFFFLSNLYRIRLNIIKLCHKIHNFVWRFFGEKSYLTKSKRVSK